jgi:hypothetical protein
MRKKARFPSMWLNQAIFFENLLSDLLVEFLLSHFRSDLMLPRPNYQAVATDFLALCSELASGKT